MRLFIATELPDSMLDALAETSAALRAQVRGRYVGTDSFHVTLAFLGNVDNWRVNDIAELMDDTCAPHSAFETSLGELGYFGRTSKATLWQGFTDRTAFSALAKSVRSELARLDFSFDGKGFIPHVTLMRNADLREGALPMPCVARGTISTVTLFASDLSGDRPIYTPLHRTNLFWKSLNGDELLEKYEELKPKFLDFAGKIIEAEESVENGHTTTYATIRKNIKDKYGV